MRPVRSIFAAVALALAATALGGVATAQEHGTVLTIAGGEKSNRGPYDAFLDGFLKYHEKKFDKAFALDFTALAALPQHKITANAEGWPGPQTLEGPLLTDVLAQAGISGKDITLFALDGYGSDMTAAQIASKPWVLAIKAGGKPLGIGGRGPAWLAYDTGAAKVTQAEEGPWVWSVFYIEAAQ